MSEHLSEKYDHLPLVNSYWELFSSETICNFVLLQQYGQTLKSLSVIYYLITCLIKRLYTLYAVN